MYGYAPEEIVGKPIAVLAAEDRVQETDEILRKIAKGERVCHFEALRRRKDGSTFPVSVTVSPIRDYNGSVVGASSIARDITEQRRAAEIKQRSETLERSAAKLLIRAEDLERANRNLEAFTYCVSHDLRAPLRALSGFSALLLEDYGDRLDEVGRGYAARIEAAAERMARLIDDVLQLTRISRAIVRHERVDLGTEVKTVADELQRREPNRRVKFVIEEGVCVNADRVLITTVLENLVGNAWKFSSRCDEATIEFGTMPSVEPDEVCCYVPRRWRRIRCRLCREAVPTFPAASLGGRVPGNRCWARECAPDRRAPRWHDMGGGRRRPWGDLLLHAQH